MVKLWFSWKILTDSDRINYIQASIWIFLVDCLLHILTIATHILFTNTKECHILVFSFYPEQTQPKQYRMAAVDDMKLIPINMCVLSSSSHFPHTRWSRIRSLVLLLLLHSL